MHQFFKYSPKILLFSESATIGHVVLMIFRCSLRERHNSFNRHFVCSWYIKKICAIQRWVIRSFSEKKTYKSVELSPKNLKFIRLYFMKFSKIFYGQIGTRNENTSHSVAFLWQKWNNQLFYSTESSMRISLHIFNMC